MKIRAVFFLLITLLSPFASAADINGIWKHSDKPGWIELRMEEGIGVVVRNDVYPERVGREVLKELEPDESVEGIWRGQIYVERFGEYRTTEISLPEPNRMRFKIKVGFMSRTLEWLRVEELPAQSVD